MTKLGQVCRQGFVKVRGRGGSLRYIRRFCYGAFSACSTFRRDGSCHGGHEGRDVVRLWSCTGAGVKSGLLPVTAPSLAP